MGHYCEQAFRFDEAKKKFNETTFDFIILDLNLPDAYGERLVKNIQNISNSKVIILTSETDKQAREGFFKDGILDYIVKDEHFDNSISDIDKDIKLIESNQNCNILVIDDSKLIRKHVGQILEVRNYSVFQAENARSGIEVLNKETINVIILDMELPDMHGLDVIREIKATPKISSIPIMVLSGSNDPGIIRNCLKLGALTFIRKPFNIEEFILKVDISSESNKKDRAILVNQKLLNEYKSAVDNSSIVSKIDLEGNNTYVNQKFQELSGYSQEELIGKSFSIVLDPDYNEDELSEIFKALERDGYWKGVLKSKGKNGNSYFIDNVISPITDIDGNLVEFISVANDVTEINLIKERLENELNMTEDNFKDMYQLSREYEKAIDKSNILSRFDVNGKITYVNQLFCETSGYKKEEVVGKSYEIICDQSANGACLKQISNAISVHSVWQGQMQFKTKSKEVYYLYSTIIPILDRNGNLVEYIDISHNITDVIELHQDIEDTQREVVYKMGEVAETRSQETGQHVKRVAEYSRLLGELYGLGEKKAELLCTASPMHDIGKVGIPDSILKKPAKLDADEWEIMKTHAKMGYDILKKSTRPLLKAAATIAYTHHEKWDGSGYPNATAGEKIHIFGRITAIADVFDALISERCYKEAWELDRVLEYFKEQRSKQFDPTLTDIFLNNIDSFLEIKNKYQDE